MKFFKPEDFYKNGELDTRKTPIEVCNIANDKLEREGKIIYTNPWDCSFEKNEHTDGRALLINIEPIKQPDKYPDHDRESLIANMEVWIEQAKTLEKELSELKSKCKHPKEKVIEASYIGRLQDQFNGYECECGVRVQPKEFEEVK